jgi:hypothetical protein
MEAKKTELKIFNYLTLAAFFITIAMTPWANSDSLIIPKLIILFCVGLAILPIILVFRKMLFYTIFGKLLVFILILIILQLIAVVLVTTAPIEQQFFGRTGRGLGFATEVSLILILVAATLTVKQGKIKILQLGLMVSGFITSTYSVLQRFGLDIFDWVTRTNGIIGTLGNPNFQSSFAAMALLPAIVYFWNKKFGKILAIAAILPLVSLIYISQSTQGYITALTGVFIFGLFYFWYSKKLVFYSLLILFMTSAIVAISGMLNKGPLSAYLYKDSVRARGDFFRTSITIANENLFFGVGLDSLGDNYLKYIDARTASSINEYADNSHNLFLQYASTGGYILAILQYVVVGFVLYSFFRSQQKLGKFQPDNIAVFCAWICYQQQALISPANISMLTWNALISGTLLGLFLQSNDKDRTKFDLYSKKVVFIRPFSYFLFIIGIIITYPYYKVDNQQVQAYQTANGDLAVKSALSYPESSIRYARIGQELINSNLLDPALLLGRAAVKFNPNAPSAWGLILVNNSAPLEERIQARKELEMLDPFNKDIKDKFSNFSDIYNQIPPNTPNP